MDLKADLSWLQKHERLILCTLALAVICFLGNKWIDRAADKAEAALAVAQHEVEQARSEASQAASQYQATIDALSRQNASLAAAVAQRQVVLEQKQTEIKTLPLPQVASEWQRLIGGSGDIVFSTLGMSVSEDGARRTVSQLEAVPVLQADVADQKVIIENQKKEIDAGASLVGKLNQQIEAEQAVHKADVAAVKAEARKSKRKWFIAGFISGLATRVLFKW